MPGTTEKNKIKNNVKVPAAPVLKTYKTKSATDAQMKAAKESISKGDKKAIKKGDLKGGLKRQAKRSAGEAGRDINKKARIKERDTNKKGRQADSKAKKESIEAAGSRKAARLTNKSDAAKSNEKLEIEKYSKSRKPYERGKARKETAKAYKQVGKAELKTDRVGERLKKEQKKVVEKGQKDDRKKSEKNIKTANKKIESDIKTKDKKTKKSQKNQLAASGSTDTKISGSMRGSIAKNMESYDQMDTVNANETAAKMNDGPIKYFKQSIKYNNSAKATAIKVAADEKDMVHASSKGKKELKHDVSSMISHASPSPMNKPMTYMKGSVKKRPSFMDRMTKNSK